MLGNWTEVDGELSNSERFQSPHDQNLIKNQMYKESNFFPKGNSSMSCEKLQDNLIMNTEHLHLGLREVVCLSG